MAEPASAVQAAEGAESSQGGELAQSASHMVPFVTDLITQGASMVQGKRMQERAFEHQKKMYGSRFQMMVKDLRKAGLNPMLAYMSPSSYPSAAAGSPAHPSSASSSLLKSQELNQIRKMQESVMEVNSALSKKHQADEKKAIEETGVAKKMVNKIVQETEKVRRENMVRETITKPFEIINSAEGFAEGIGERIGEFVGKKSKFKPKIEPRKKKGEKRKRKWF